MVRENSLPFQTGEWERHDYYIELLSFDAIGAVALPEKVQDWFDPGHSRKYDEVRRQKT